MKKEFPLIINGIFSNYTIKSLFRIKDYIESDIQQHMVLKRLAKKGGTNECTLKKGFKHLFKTTVYQYLLKTRMNRANYLLRETTLREQDIAKQCGYETLSGFINSFQKYYGIPPRQARKALKI